ncbi:MAG: hypothetical protein HN348_17485 [Proteobacteria bacterium]|nr:hypothetical protein [Pseudomonadota bacterium]
MEYTDKLPDDTDTPDETDLAPVIKIFEATVDSITEGDQVEFVARVTDVDGQEDLQGGMLKSIDGLVYGTFAQVGDSVEWKVSLDWDIIHDIEPILFDEYDVRVFVAEFRDKSKKQATAELELELHCDGRPACDGYCGMAGTNNSDCNVAGWQECVEVQAQANFNCADVCSQSNMDCAQSTEGEIWGLAFSHAACSAGVFEEVGTSLSTCDMDTSGDSEWSMYASCYCG